MCLSNFKAIGKVWTRISGLRDFTRSCHKTSYRLVNRGPGPMGFGVVEWRRCLGGRGKLECWCYLPLMVIGCVGPLDVTSDISRVSGDVRWCFKTFIIQFGGIQWSYGFNIGGPLFALFVSEGLSETLAALTSGGCCWLIRCAGGISGVMVTCFASATVARSTSLALIGWMGASSGVRFCCAGDSGEFIVFILSDQSSSSSIHLIDLFSSYSGDATSHESNRGWGMRSGPGAVVRG